MLEHQHVGPAGIRMPMDLSNSQFHDQPHQQMPHMNPVFLNPMNIPFHGAEKGSAHPQVNSCEASVCWMLIDSLQVGQFPLLDPRLQYLQWASNPLASNPLASSPLASNPLASPYLRTPGPVPPLAPPYLHSLAQFHNLKALQQNLAKTLLASHAPQHSNCESFDFTHCNSSFCETLHGVVSQNIRSFVCGAKNDYNQHDRQTGH